MAQRYAVRITLQSQRKGCPNGHRVGDSWVVDGKTPGGMCTGAYNSMAPYLMALRFGATFPWEEEGRVTICCPDPEVMNVFLVERIAREDADDDPATA